MMTLIKCLMYDSGQRTLVRQTGNEMEMRLSIYSDSGPDTW